MPNIAAYLTPENIQAAMKISGAAGKVGKNILLKKGLIKAKPAPKKPAPKKPASPVVAKPIIKPWYVEYKTPLIIGSVIVVTGLGIAAINSSRR